jgi:hypothetical protein
VYVRDLPQPLHSVLVRRRDVQVEDHPRDGLLVRRKRDLHEARVRGDVFLEDGFQAL